MKRNHVLKAFSASLLVAGVMASLPAIANAAAYYTYYPTAVQVNGSTVSTPGHIQEKDPFGGPSGVPTSFLPIWYVDQALQKFGAKVSWGGTNGILNITTPSGMTVNYPSAPRPVTINSGTMVIQINGNPVTYAPRIDYYDQGSGGNGSAGILTTFVPVYYLEQSLKYLGVTTNWNGTDWTMDYGTVTPPVPTNETVKAAAAVAFAKAMGIAPDNSLPNPYSDVSAGEWKWIEPLVSNNFVYKHNTEYGGGFQVQMGTSVFQPESSTQFGSNVTMAQIDRAFQIASGWLPGHDAYLPGGSVTAFASVVGVNNGLPSSGNLSMTDVGTLSANLTRIEKGYAALGNNQYQLVYRPQAAGNYWENTTIPASVASQNEYKAIQLINKTVITYLGGNNFETKAPDLIDNSGLFITGENTPQTYSLNNGATWQTASGGYGFNSSDPNNGGTSNPPNYVLLKNDNGAGGIMVDADYDGAYQIAGGGGLVNENGALVPNYR